MPWILLAGAAISAGVSAKNGEDQKKAGEKSQAQIQEQQDYARNGPLGSTYAPGGAATYNYALQLLGVPGAANGAYAGGPQKTSFVGGQTGGDPQKKYVGNLDIGGKSGLFKDPVGGAIYKGTGVDITDPAGIFGKHSKITPIDVQVDPSKDWKAFWDGSPDLQKEWNSNSKLREQFSNDPNKYAAYSYQNGLGDRQLNDVSQNGATNGAGQPTGGADGPLSQSQGMTQAYQNFLDSTGYKTNLNSGVDAINSSQAAKGLLNSGATGKALTRFGQGLGASYFNNYIQQLMGASAQGIQAGSAVLGNGTSLAGTAATNINNQAATQAQNNQNTSDNVIFGINSVWGNGNQTGTTKPTTTGPGTNNPTSGGATPGTTFGGLSTYNPYGGA